ncbi:MAP kinase kinase Wis1 [Elasticomyces elasticus]|uniref:mitogen-activated protein kinase kinase n=1 Tax=Exophiala sideris TaxID=1016849 RepID=A0ABR0JIA0_9EURO|nr:MAP kinase kinase Wis1 [Elasticomyces elasticus]KAK5033327.1 MAP kinase kinase Wis1 [Exophiala sideris]KAK5042176.1 MAP kinase kinase Wis1 [Exophiala sideris]KAK5063871.1 MAP kinase kinase Wis1 [Exophiala sideris]KAK5185444.1 MAP kinase kinase Wis1 [Eurotiomycetes sp. CCFEE 6388]
MDTTQIQQPSSPVESGLEREGSQSPQNTSQPSSPESTARAPSLNAQGSSMASTMSPSSAPLGPTNAARRPGPLPGRASGLNSDIQAKMKAFSQSRRGAPPPSTQNLRNPQQPGGPGGVVGGALTGASPTSPTSSPAGLRVPGGLSRPGAPSFGSTPSPVVGTPRMNSPKPMGGLAAKRGLKGALKLSDAQKPQPAGQEAEKQDTGSQFNKFANIIDTKTGTLNFQNKAVIHGSGIDFAGGSTFSISLDEVDTIAELGKGNYGTVFKVRHARPRMRRPGLGLRGNMVRQASASAVLEDGETDLDSANKDSGTSGLVMAMKEIRLELDDTKFAQIIMELDILHRCVSPFIIDFYGAFFQEGSVYICIEYMDGGSIDKLYGDGVPEGVLKKITLSTVMGLKCLKDDHNIIHRDVKPTNILVNTRGQVKICDFGVSGNLVASIAKTNIGCQSYMAPERISGGGIAQVGAGGGSYSVQSDIWSLGLTIIECALGRYPYPPETYDNIFSQLSAIVDGDPPDLPADKFSEAAIDFVRGCLNKIPRLRPTYTMLLRHGWLAPLMKPPTISEDEEGEQAAESGIESAFSNNGIPDTADKEVAKWVIAALERKKAGKMAVSKKPALHEAPLDAVPGSPLLAKSEADAVAGDSLGNLPVPVANEPVEVDAPDLLAARVQGLDFASP